MNIRSESSLKVAGFETQLSGWFWAQDDNQQARHQPLGRRGQQDYFLYTANNVHQTPVPIFNCPADPTMKPGVNPITQYAPSSYAANYLVFGNVDEDFANKNAQGNPRLVSSFLNGSSNTILFVEKYASASNASYRGGCHWAYFQADCHNPFLGYHEPGQGASTDPGAVGERSLFQVQPNPSNCNPCRPATGHTSMNVCMADASVKALSAGMDAHAWWALASNSIHFAGN